MSVACWLANMHFSKFKKRRVWPSRTPRGSQILIIFLQIVETLLQTPQHKPCPPSDTLRLRTSKTFGFNTLMSSEVCTNNASQD